MSYSIIFETKIVKLSDGRIIHFDRSGCNNDNVGRRKDDFTAKIYTVDEFVQKAESYKKNSKPYKKSDCTEFINSFCFRVEHLTGIQLHKPEEKFMTVEEFDKAFYKLLYSGSGMTYTRLMEHPDIKDEENLVRLIEAGECLAFEIRSW